MRGTIRKRFGCTVALASLVGSLLIVIVPAGGAAAAACLATGAQDRDGTTLTARVVNPAGPVSGKVDATGCSVGVYFSQGSSGRVTRAEVFGARYYGVLVDGSGHTVHVDVAGSNFHDIGDAPITAVRHGQGIAYRSFGGGSATGTVSGNTVWNFQEAGINQTGPGSTVTVIGNTVRGRGPLATISQNGIQVIFGAHGTVLGNRISDLSYQGPIITSAIGVIVVGGPIYNGNPTSGCLPSGCDYPVGVHIEGNLIANADIGVVILAADEDFSPAPDPTGNVVARNLIRNVALSNVNGWDTGVAYQAGISDYANGDHIVDNVILGRGYHADFCGDAGVCLGIDTEGSTGPFVSGNVIR